MLESIIQEKQGQKNTDGDKLYLSLIAKMWKIAKYYICCRQKKEWKGSSEQICRDIFDVVLLFGRFNRAWDRNVCESCATEFTR